jgi:hypothetical protein
MSVLANAVPFLSLLIHSLLIYKVNHKGEREVGHHKHQIEEVIQWYGHIKKMSKERIQKLIIKCIPRERIKKWTSKKNVGVRSSSNHFNKKLKTKSIDKQERMEFVFLNTATALIKPDS